MQNRFKCKFELKQITPMIHFQYNQTGATVRATELKPKLDRFILEMSSKTSDPKLEDLLSLLSISTDDKKELIQTLHIIHTKKSTNLFLENPDETVKALAYKVKIRTKDEFNLSKRFPVYTMPRKDRKIGIGDYFIIDSEDKESSFYSKIYVEFLSFQPELLKLIKMVFPLFIATTNFGFRQNKAFGHFLVTYCDAKKVELDLEKVYISYRNLYKEKYLIYRIELDPETDYFNMFKQLKIFNKNMKGGVNGKNSYLLCEYIKGCNYQNEKIFLKDVVCNMNKNNKSMKEATSVENVRYFRGMLGFANHYHVQSPSGGEKLVINVRYCAKGESESSIKRFPSPLYYLPTMKNNKFNCIYVLVNRSSIEKLIKSQMDAEFEFDAQSEEQDPVKMRVKLLNDFNIENFLDSYSERINKASQFDGKLVKLTKKEGRS